MDSAVLIENLASPITLAFLLGVLATLIRSDLEVPEPVIRIFAIFLLLSIGLQGGRELATADLGNLGAAILVTAAFVVGVPALAFVGTGLATAAGLPLGSAFVLGAVAASASCIDAPAAVRATFPDANPSIWLTASLGVTVPFMLILGIPAVYAMAAVRQGALG